MDDPEWLKRLDKVDPTAGIRVGCCCLGLVFIIGIVWIGISYWLGYR